MDFRNYDPSNVSFTFQGQTITGYQDGTFIDAEREESGFTKHVGSRGDVTRTRNLNRTGKVTLTLMAAAPSNDVLQSIADTDEQFGLGTGTLQIMDHNGTMEFHASIAWIMKQPKIDRAKETGATVWVFECADITLHNGGEIV